MAVKTKPPRLGTATARKLDHARLITSVNSLPNPPGQCSLVEIAGWPRNSRETVRIRLDRYNEAEIVDNRCWWRDEAGELRPGESVITLSVRQLPALASGLDAAMRKAIERGLLPPETGEAAP
jgi:hypothetical protein